MDIKSIAAMIAGIGAVIGVGATFWSTQIQLDEMRAGEELRDQQIRTLRIERDKMIEERQTPYDPGISSGCRDWVQELQKLIVDKDTGLYTYKAIQNISQTERDSFHELCKDREGLLYQYINECVDMDCYRPRFGNDSLINVTIINGEFVPTNLTKSEQAEYDKIRKEMGKSVREMTGGKK